MNQTTDAAVDGDFAVGARLAEDFPQFDRLANESVVGLVKTYILLADHLQRELRPYGVSLTGFMILGLIRVAGGRLRPSMIARWLRVTRGTVTGLLDSLQSRGLIRRDADRDDRRVVLVALTEAAFGLQREMVPAMFAVEQQVVATLTQAEREELVRLLGIVRRRLLTLAEDGGLRHEAALSGREDEDLSYVQ